MYKIIEPKIKKKKYGFWKKMHSLVHDKVKYTFRSQILKYLEIFSLQWFFIPKILTWTKKSYYQYFIDIDISDIWKNLDIPAWSERERGGGEERERREKERDPKTQFFFKFCLTVSTERKKHLNSISGVVVPCWGIWNLCNLWWIRLWKKKCISEV